LSSSVFQVLRNLSKSTPFYGIYHGIILRYDRSQAKIPWVVLAAQYRKEGFIMALSDVKLKNLKAAKPFTILPHKFNDRRMPESSKPRSPHQGWTTEGRQSFFALKGGWK